MEMRNLIVICLLFIQGGILAKERSFKSTDEGPPSTIFYLVRHGQTDWNIGKRLQGQTDIPLNDSGRVEAAQLSQELDSVVFEAIFSSDLKRAAETAQILGRPHSLAVKVDQCLRERNFGPWEGVLVSEFLIASANQDLPLLKIESDEMIRKRVFPFLKEKASHYPGTTVLIVTHGGVIKSLLTQLLPINCSSFDIQVKNMAILQLKISDEKCEVQEMRGIQIPSY